VTSDSRRVRRLYYIGIALCVVAMAAGAAGLRRGVGALILAGAFIAIAAIADARCMGRATYARDHSLLWWRYIGVAVVGGIWIAIGLLYALGH
jgi:hypothetical protein